MAALAVPAAPVHKNAIVKPLILMTWRRATSTAALMTGRRAVFADAVKSWWRRVSAGALTTGRGAVFAGAFTTSGRAVFADAVKSW
jgi:hypothetical protein